MPEFCKKLSPEIKGASIKEIILLCNLVGNKKDYLEWVKFYNELIRKRRNSSNDENGDALDPFRKNGEISVL